MVFKIGCGFGERVVPKEAYKMYVDEASGPLRRKCADLGNHGPVAQWLERRAYTSVVVGSTPTGPTNLMLYITILMTVFGIAALASGARAGRRDLMELGAIFFVAAVGGAMITFFSLSAF